MCDSAKNTTFNNVDFKSSVEIKYDRIEKMSYSERSLEDDNFNDKGSDHGIFKPCKKSLHNDTKKKSCPNCDFKTSTRGRLRCHINVVNNKFKDHICSYCGYSTSHREGLKLHIKALHHKIRDKICHICGYSASHATLLKQHMKLVHERVKDKVCETCDYKTTKKQNLQAHIKAVHEKLKDNVCSQCGYSTSSDSNLKKHMKIVHFKIKDKVCNMCGHATTLTGDLRKHMRVVHKVIMKAPTLLKYTPSSYQGSSCLDTLLNVNLPDNSAMLKIPLNFESIAEDNFKTNLRKMKPELGPTLDCPNINNDLEDRVNEMKQAHSDDLKMSLTKSDLNFPTFNARLNTCDDSSGLIPTTNSKQLQHGNSDNNGTPSDKDNLSKVNNINELVKQAIEQSTLEKLLPASYTSDQEPDKQKSNITDDYLVINCADDPFCDKESSPLSKRKYKKLDLYNCTSYEHQANKKEDLTLSIQVCSSREIGEGDPKKQDDMDECVVLEDDALLSNRQKKYICDSCSYVTTRLGHLKRHIKSVHHKSRDKACSLCSYATSDKGNLKKHIKAIHEKIKDQICDLCGFSTTDFSSLKKHIKEVHHKIKDKICSMCEFTTARNAELKHHIKGVHDKVRDKICETCGYATTDNSNLRKHIRKVHKGVGKSSANDKNIVSVSVIRS